MTGTLLFMTYTSEDRARIAELVRRARIEKQLDKEPAARAADVSSITWKRVEDAEGVRDASLGKILSYLELPSADELLGRSSPGRPSPHDLRMAIHEAIKKLHTVSDIAFTQEEYTVLTTSTDATARMAALLHSPKERGRDVLETTQKPNAPSQARTAQEVKSVHDSQHGGDVFIDDDLASDYTGVNRADDGEDGDDLAGGQV